MKPRRHAFTLTELLVVMGLIGTLMSLLLPAVGKARAAARSAACLSNLRQMATAWAMYTSENRGRLMPYVFNTPSTPDIAWNGYWTGALDANGVKGEVLLCPSADEPIDVPQKRGYGNAAHAWTGKYASNGSGIRASQTVYRDGSYGYNRYLTAGAFNEDGTITSISQVRNLSDVPLFMDCAYADVRPDNGSDAAPVTPPPNLHGGGVAPGAPEHWKVLLARHRRGINAAMADGSVRYVPLDDVYMLTWKADWIGYRLNLPGN
jgi:prepilin-type N-terminal cleavage/methylation domain-containing protein/prepilin-type processing-associated H-X9-DG protein